MKSILTYGDSNTWGANPKTGERLPLNERWPGILRSELGDGHHIIEEGLSGRTTVHDDPFDPSRNGRTYLPPCLASHAPLDLVIIMLGTNDLKCRFAVPAIDIAYGVGALIEITLRSGAGPGGTPPQVLLIAPPPIREIGEGVEMFRGGAVKSARFGQHYRAIAETHRCGFLDASTVVASSPIDGVHLDAEAHRVLGIATAQRVREMLR